VQQGLEYRESTGEPRPDGCHVVVLSPSALVAQSLARLVARFAGLVASPCVLGPTATLGGFGWRPADVVLLDAPSAGWTDGVAEQIRVAWPASRVVLVVRTVGPWCDRAVTEMGAVGWITSEVTPHELARTLSTAHRSGRLPSLLSRPRPKVSQHDALVAALTGRELQTLRLLAAGLGPIEISRQLAISANTVRAHVQNVMSKLGVHSRLEAVAVARRAGVRATPVDLPADGGVPAASAAVRRRRAEG
jgi:DNA-binding NarL/FixJ family response regulator